MAKETKATATNVGRVYVKKGTGVPNVEKMRHTLSHILAAAVTELYPTAKFGIGPAIDDGFYYDIDFGKTKVVEADLDPDRAPVALVRGEYGNIKITTPHDIHVAESIVAGL